MGTDENGNKYYENNDEMFGQLTRPPLVHVGTAHGVWNGNIPGRTRNPIPTPPLPSATHTHTHTRARARTLVVKRHGDPSNDFPCANLQTAFLQEHTDLSSTPTMTTTWRATFLLNGKSRPFL